MLTIEKTNDVLIINELDQLCFLDQSYNINTYKNMIKNHYFYLIRKEDKIIGFFIILNLGKEIEVIKIGIKNEWRRKGYAFKALNIFLTTYDFKKCFLEVSKNNINAINLYFKLGFKNVSTRKKYYQDGSDALNFIYIKS